MLHFPSVLGRAAVFWPASLSLATPKSPKVINYHSAPPYLAKMILNDHLSVQVDPPLRGPSCRWKMITVITL
ncbi:hypothetical protein N656DRAFT_776544 [Canariomyces notabilis]|uniref:Uncharacterized protein n=1 Tax=Canariomyces notabilis TaxID=2074819 RepID=A0AAN6TJ36_9PEZI|nr:hypothetical protein N656DRAFT_776544 [Canariomyces arenarius]